MHSRKMNSRKKLPLICALLLIFASFTSAQTRLPKIQFTDTTLENGLRVVIVPDNTAPVVAVSMTYNTGSRNEKQGRTGFAHLFEHMMFEGSANVGKGEHMLLVQNYGGTMNGTTNSDRTNYFEEMPRNQLDMALFLESDRMKALNITQANLDNQRNAVQEERRLRVDNQPYGKSGEALESMVYDAFPYHHSVIGSMEDLNAASIDDVKEFFRVYYAPNNAVLVLVGDLDTKEALGKVKKYFGDIPRQSAPPPVDMTESPHGKERRSTMEDTLARLPQIQAAYPGPVGNTQDFYTLQVLSNILSGGRSSRLYEHLVRQKQLAVNVFAGIQERRGPGLFRVVALPRPGVKPEDLEAAIYDEFEAVKKDGITPQELEKARVQLLRADIQGRSSALGLANRIGMLTVYFNDPGLINTAYEKIAAVTASQIQTAAQKYLVPENRAVVITTPHVSGSKPGL